LQRTKRVETMLQGSKVILDKLKNGQALEKFRQMLVAQGVSEQMANELCLKRNYNLVFNKKSTYVTQLKSYRAGYIQAIDALVLGNIASKLGAGRVLASDKIFYEVGFRLLKTVGDRVKLG
jgi:thymidine phosphorylase